MPLVSANENRTLPSLKGNSTLDSGAHLEHSPVEFGVAHSKNETFLASSIDRFSVLQVYSRSKEVEIKIKSEADTSTKNQHFKKIWQIKYASTMRLQRQKLQGRNFQ